MYVHVEILEARGSLAGLGSDPRDQVVFRAGLPPSPRSNKALPVKVFTSPIIGQQAGIALPADVANDIKHELTKRTKHRALDNYLARLMVTKNGHWVGTIFVRLLCLANGYVVERWVNLKPAAGVEAGALRVRIVVREDEQAALAVFAQGESVEPNEMSRTEGCECDVCDPYGELYDPVAKQAQLEKDGRKVISVLSVCTIS